MQCICNIAIWRRWIHLGGITFCVSPESWHVFGARALSLGMKSLSNKYKVVSSVYVSAPLWSHQFVGIKTARFWHLFMLQPGLSLWSVRCDTPTWLASFWSINNGTSWRGFFNPSSWQRFKTWNLLGANFGSEEYTGRPITFMSTKMMFSI